MTISLGIDTGGTYTDAVLVDHSTGSVLATAKALTTRHDLSIGITEAVVAVFAAEVSLRPEAVSLVSLSTTLATNAIAEGQGSPICLLLIGYDRGLMEQYGFHRQLATEEVVYLRGGHDVLGNEVEPLDESAVRQAILSHAARVEAFAVSGYFSVRNPTHELRVRSLVEELAGLPVSCGHDLSTRLNAVRRATTVALNARLIPLLQELVATVSRTLDSQAIAAPLMVVKGDGSLVHADWAMERPIETVLSGPAASAVGGWHLAGGTASDSAVGKDVWVVDVGGTTTDIASLENGQPSLCPDGARVGGWRTMVEAVNVHTTGLGGDSLVQPDGNGRLQIGPRRVVPLCLLAAMHPQVIDELRRQNSLQEKGEEVAQFALQGRRPGNRHSDEDASLLQKLEGGPQSLALLFGQARYGSLVRRRLEDLEAQLVVQRAGFTPTDALHVLGRFQRWNAEASLLGSLLLADRTGMTAEAFSEAVVRETSDRVTKEVVSKVLEDEIGQPDWGREPTAASLLERALSTSAHKDLQCDLTLGRPLVAIGAPVQAYMVRVADSLHTELIIPPHAEVASAVGAVSGSVIYRQRILINPLNGGERFRVHLLDGVIDFSDLEEAVRHARATVQPQVAGLARRAGAEHVEVKVDRSDRTVRLGGGWGEELHLGTDLIFTAVGRPSPARRKDP